MQLSETVKWLETKITNMTKENARNKESFQGLQRNVKDIQGNSVQFTIVLILLVGLFLNAVVTMVFVIKIIQWRKNQMNILADMELH